MTAELLHLLKPDPEAMRSHLDHLFGGFLDGFHDGLIELCWTDAKPDDGGRYKLRHAQLFGTDQTEELIDKACAVNAQGRVNVYIGAALRDPNTAPFGRTHDRDFYAATCVWTDLDDEDANNQAKHRFVGARPTMVVRTGKHPHWRHQLWWRLAEPITDPVRLAALVKGMAVHFSGDGSVSNPGRVMRLAGSIAWDQKPGRIAELTGIIQLKEPGPSTFMAEHLELIYPPLFDIASVREHRERNERGPDNGIVRERNGLGLDTGRVTDGREKYMRDLVCARLIEYVGRFGAAPSAEELFDEAWPAYEKSADLSRPGRGKHEFMEKCRYTVGRFLRGEIRGAATLDEAAAVYRQKKDARQNSVRQATLVEAPSSADSQSSEPPAIKATAFDWVDPRSIPPRAWVYGRHYIRKFISTTVAPGGVGKTALEVVEMLAIASGRPLLGIAPDEQTKVWIWNGEDPVEEMQRRIMAAALHHGLKPADIAGRIFMDTGRVTPIIIAEKTRDGALINAPIIEQVIATITENQIGVMSIDPFVSCHRVSENDNSEIERVAKSWAHIADVTGCAIELVHHVRKTNGNEVSVEDGRGAVALLSAARAARALNRMTADEAAKAGVTEPGLYFRTDNGKANLAPPSSVATWYHLASYDLQNATAASSTAPQRPSDKVGVVESWQWPDHTANVSAGDMWAVRARVAEGRFRVDQQSPDWVGKAIIEVMGGDKDDPKARAQAVQLQKMWTENKVLEEYDDKDDRRRSRRFVRPGPFKDERAPP